MIKKIRLSVEVQVVEHTATRANDSRVGGLLLPGEGAHLQGHRRGRGSVQEDRRGEQARSSLDDDLFAKTT